MTSHELAHKILEFPDKPLWANIFGRSIPMEGVHDFGDIITLFPDMRKDYGLILMPQDRVQILVNASDLRKDPTK